MYLYIYLSNLFYNLHDINICVLCRMSFILTTAVQIIVLISTVEYYCTKMVLYESIYIYIFIYILVY